MIKPHPGGNQADDHRRNPAVPIGRDAEFGASQKNTPDVKSSWKQIHEEPYVNSEDLIQESVLKKLKLHLKDQMELIVARYQHGMMQQHKRASSSPRTSVVQYRVFPAAEP